MPSNSFNQQVSTLLREVYLFSDDDHYYPMIEFWDDLIDHFETHVGDSNIKFFEWVRALEKMDKTAFYRMSRDKTVINKFICILICVLGSHINIARLFRGHI